MGDYSCCRLQDKIDYRMNNENINKLDIFLAAGETSDFPILKEKFKSIIPNVLISGNMRMELLKKYRNLLEKDTHVIKKIWRLHFIINRIWTNK